ncbi:HAD family hydrolase [Salinibaculum rarum]|uniref:HAD family hydrolase n=1 Tax=Salinibaculum rarum TaxID=3058903 RepID=UPI00265EC429|nr:HAD family hydrolase [Salinibaculum sp. KK48]
MQSSVDAVLFDIDDTLCSYRRSGGEILPLAFEQVGVEPFFTVDEYVDRYREFTAASEDMNDLRKRCFATFAAERGHDPAVGRAVARAYESERDHTNVQFCPGARETLAMVDGDVAVAAVTNGAPEMQAAKLDTLGIADYFQTVVHAGYDTAPKPDPDPFHAALDHLDVTPERTLHVGNSLASDVAGGQRAGVQTAWVHGDTDPAGADPKPDYTLSTVGELRRLWK